MLAFLSLSLLAVSDNIFATVPNDMAVVGDGLLGLGLDVVLCTGDEEAGRDGVNCPTICSRSDGFSFLDSTDPGLDEGCCPEEPSVAFLDELGLGSGLFPVASVTEGDGLKRNPNGGEDDGFGDPSVEPISPEGLGLIPENQLKVEAVGDLGL